MFEGTLYFAGPMTLWSQKPVEMEFIARFPARWLWLARMTTRSAYGPLDHAQVGYLIKRGNVILEHVKARAEIVQTAEASV